MNNQVAVALKKHGRLADIALPNLHVEIARRYSNSISVGGVWFVRYFTTLTVTFGQNDCN